MTKNKPGRRLKYNEPTIKVNYRVPLGAVTGIDAMIKRYLELYLISKQRKILNNDKNENNENSNLH